MGYSPHQVVWDLVDTIGFEPIASELEIQRSILLGYIPKLVMGRLYALSQQYFAFSPSCLKAEAGLEPAGSFISQGCSVFDVLHVALLRQKYPITPVISRPSALFPRQDAVSFSRVSTITC